jgi:hypothetical protein
LQCFGDDLVALNYPPMTAFIRPSSITASSIY